MQIDGATKPAFFYASGEPAQEGLVNAETGPELEPTFVYVSGEPRADKGIACGSAPPATQCHPSAAAIRRKCDSEQS